MRMFNPEKELNKIQKGNKNKVILGVGLLLLIVAIGSSYALYQIKYNKRIIYTTVEPFFSKDIILSVKLDDQEKSTNKFPTKEEGYVYSHIECENGNIINDRWDTDTWNLNASIKGPDKCTVFFVKSPFHMKSCEGKEMSECLLEEGEKFTNILAFDDPDQNGRYIGTNPTNYIWFNCDDYSKPTEETCERWRIIGSFKNIEKVVSVSEEGETTYEKQNLVKIIRENRVGILKWDINNISNWETASLQIYLNNNYLTEGDDGSWIDSYKDTNYKPLTKTTQQIIEKIKWNIGGWHTSDITAAEFYTHERGEVVLEGYKPTWNGFIGLMYPSDFGFNVGGGEQMRAQCLDLTLYRWADPTFNSVHCWEADWLPGYGLWFMMPNSKYPDAVLSIHSHYVGWASQGYSIKEWTAGAYPTLYLTHDTKITSGDGTYDNPYVINVN